jgi:hypothetical protein
MGNCDPSAGIVRSMIHDAAGIGRSMIHHAAGCGRSMIHDAAGIVRSMIHHAAGIVRWMIHDAAGGPYNGLRAVDPWALAALDLGVGASAPPLRCPAWAVYGVLPRRGIIGVMTRTLCHRAAIIAHRSPRPLKNPQVDRSVGRLCRGGFQPTLHASRIDPRTHPAAPRIVDRPISAAPRIVDRPISAASWIIDRGAPPRRGPATVLRAGTTTR